MRAERFVDAGGVRLRALVEGEGPPVLILHGFTGRAEAMEDVAAGLRDRYRTVRADLAGHGRSGAPRSADAYRMDACVRQLAHLLDALDAPAARVVGYSMGGRAALSLAVAEPSRVRALALIGASAGIEDAAERAARERADRALADSIERDGLPAFVERWMALPLFQSQQRLGREALAAARAQRLASAPHGLAGSLRGMGTGAQPPLHAALPELAVPTLFLVGEEDAKFREIAAALAPQLRDARVCVIPEAGHATHLENPAATLAAIRAHFGAHPGAHFRAHPGAPRPAEAPAFHPKELEEA